MPSFFNFQEDAESGGPVNEATPLLGRFRAVPNTNRSLGKNSFKHRISHGFPGLRLQNTDYLKIHINAARRYSHDSCATGAKDLGRINRWGNIMKNFLLEPEPKIVRKVVEQWWSRWVILIILPSTLAVAWCAIPFPKYELSENSINSILSLYDKSAHKTPGHGKPKVEINFWYFLFVYYGLYNITALVWITKAFNIYGLNWWPGRVGFPVTLATITVFSIIIPIPIYYSPRTRLLLKHNTTWMCWTFFMISLPMLLAITSLLAHERHLSLRNPLSETQRIFTSTWWNRDHESKTTVDYGRHSKSIMCFSPSSSSQGETRLLNSSNLSILNGNLSMQKRWIPASFMRFIWFSTALFISIFVYVLGEAYAEIYLRTLPHSTFQTIVYVYTWVVTVHLLDGVVGWILGGNDGERVGSYPLGWVFKLYFALTYQTYVRALYARLRSPSQFLVLQVLSSSVNIILTPLTIWKRFHSILKFLRINGQTLQQYQKFCVRNIFIRSIAECVSMLAFLGSILVLHYGPNKDVYPYFAFEPTLDTSLSPHLSSYPPPLPPSIRRPSPASDEYGYDFGLTFYASIDTFACEIVAAWTVRRILWFGWQLDVTKEAIHDLKSWPEILPTIIVVMVHVLQNMLFSIVRLRFH
ncbi:Uncharacterized protein OnM2_025076 [Erysiphe neolycopersici]|uniref:Uncharacterized protein n=1 Tax=Erysiphe neolycopersici TaxID=212602 RepID=A0A420I182_9PEZI|nr:Uncharacterized protein OnM2_025076 [Erysiphe neolycopersici]